MLVKAIAISVTALEQYTENNPGIRAGRKCDRLGLEPLPSPPRPRGGNKILLASFRGD
jgi:hypothetical protein